MPQYWYKQLQYLQSPRFQDRRCPPMSRRRLRPWLTRKQRSRHHQPSRTKVLRLHRNKRRCCHQGKLEEHHARSEALRLAGRKSRYPGHLRNSFRMRLCSSCSMLRQFENKKQRNDPEKIPLNQLGGSLAICGNRTRSHFIFTFTDCYFKTS